MNDSADVEWLFGLHTVQALLKTEAERIRELRFLRGRADQRLQKIRSQADHLDISWQWATRAELDALAATGNHQGVAALCKAGGDVRDEHYLWALLEQLREPPLLLVLDGVTDPHNLGACLRTADAAGVHAVIVPKDGSAGLTPTARKVASGAADAVPLVVVTNLARTLRELRQRGLWVVGAAGEAERMIYQVDLRGPLVLALGAEDKGLRRLTREHCDSLVKVPMHGVVASLNVSVAAGVCLFEAVRQRSAPAPG
ncbi:MAG: 23S rRNA (guanosine(2251)-2'-O)-methyltransferase RlmB [Porticoccaceae bacterium]